MNRRRLLTIGGLVIGAGVLTGGGIHMFSRRSNPLGPFLRSTRTVLIRRFGTGITDDLTNAILNKYEVLRPNIPYIGGEKNLFTTWLTYGAYYLGLYKALKNHGWSMKDIGKVVYETYEVMADYPKWFLQCVGHLKYGKRYQERLKTAATESQKRKYPDDFVATFLEGNGMDFDYGLDITECAICKLYNRNDADELAPYMCLSDYVVSKAFDRGLVRHSTIAEGGKMCDFRYKAGRDTFVNPLRDGWPPKFGI